MSLDQSEATFGAVYLTQFFFWMAHVRLRWPRNDIKCVWTNLKPLLEQNTWLNFCSEWLILDLDVLEIASNEFEPIWNNFWSNIPDSIFFWMAHFRLRCPRNSIKWVWTNLKPLLELYTWHNFSSKWLFLDLDVWETISDAFGPIWSNYFGT